MREEVIWDLPHSKFVRWLDFDGDHAAKKILVFTSIGDQDVETLAEIFSRLRPVLEAEAPVLYLNDMRRIGESSLSTKWYAAQQLKANRPLIRRSAVFGASTGLVASAGAILRVAGRDDIKLFREQEEAVAWLLEA